MMNSITTMEILQLNTGIQINCKIKSNEERLKHICKTSQIKTNIEIISFLKNVSYVIDHKFYLVKFQGSIISINIKTDYNIIRDELIQDTRRNYSPHLFHELSRVLMDNCCHTLIFSAKKYLPSSKTIDKN
ncbi:hypothetical protein QTP88_028706 [Uroleucon formosanum]